MPRRAPVQGRAKLYLVINRTLYHLLFLDPQKEVADPAWRLTKTDGTSYDVALTTQGAHCSCPDYIYCREHRDPKGCKHVAAMRSVGLLRSQPVEAAR